MNAIAQLRKDCERIGCICLADEPMAAHTSFKIGGPADLLLKPRDAETAARVIARARELSVPLLFIGKGSDLLICDEGVRGAVLSFDEASARPSLRDETVIDCPAGASLTALCCFALEQGLTGKASNFRFEIRTADGKARLYSNFQDEESFDSLNITPQYATVQDGTISVLFANGFSDYFRMGVDHLFRSDSYYDAYDSYYSVVYGGEYSGMDSASTYAFWDDGGAYEALTAAREAGKIGHIGLTAHSTAVFAKALEMDWVETVMFPYNIVESQGEDLIRQCGEKNVGFTCMKPLAGGAIENATLALRYILTNPDVTVAIPGMAAEGELAQNLAAAGDASPLSDGEKAEMQAIRDSLGTQFCRRCNYCAPCSVGISIPNVFLMDGYLSRYGLADWARGRYNAMAMKAGDCIGCGECEKRCPYHLPIREMMQKVKEHFGA